MSDYLNSVVSAQRPESDELIALMKGGARYVSKATILDICVGLASSVPGSIVEFGVASGGSTRHLRQSSNKKIFALDSFEGLREKFEGLEVGHFAGPVPDIPGVHFIKGYFEDTCTDELARKVGRVAFAHLDADLYSSTLVALRWLTPLLVDGSLLLFDEFLSGDRAEGRAFLKWQAETGMTIARLAEFDREPSGAGKTPDKRLLFQVIDEKTRFEATLTWVATTNTALKASTAFSGSLSEKEKIQVKPGDIITAPKQELHGSHSKLFGVVLNREPLREPDWYILRSHWEAM